MAKTPAKTERQHKATYSRDKRTGGYNINVEGPHAAEFAGREVPVVTKDGKESMEKLDRMLWSGDSKLNPGTPAALYSFTAKPREEQEVAAF